MDNFIESELRACIVCGAMVEVDSSMDEEQPTLCILHFFDSDVSEEWEKE